MELHILRLACIHLHNCKASKGHIVYYQSEAKAVHFSRLIFPPATERTQCRKIGNDVVRDKQRWNLPWPLKNNSRFQMTVSFANGLEIGG